jgi:nucleotide-binding universal stress UspA family protein
MDGSEGSFKALGEALRLAKLYSAELHTVFVEEMPQYAATVGEVVEEQASANEYGREFMARAQVMAEAEGSRSVREQSWAMKSRPSWSSSRKNPSIFW